MGLFNTTIRFQKNTLDWEGFCYKQISDSQIVRTIHNIIEVFKLRTIKIKKIHLERALSGYDSKIVISGEKKERETFIRAFIEIMDNQITKINY